MFSLAPALFRTVPIRCRTIQPGAIHYMRLIMNTVDTESLNVCKQKHHFFLHYLKIICHMPCVMCHVSCVMCHVSVVRCHLSSTPTPTAKDSPLANSSTIHSRLVPQKTQTKNLKPKKNILFQTTMVCDLWCFEDLEEKDDLISEPVTEVFVGQPRLHRLW